MEIFEFKKDIDEMSEGQLRATAREFQAKHNEQVEDANSIEEQMTEYKEKYEEAREIADEVVEYFAGKASEVKDMDEEMLADRFSAGELREMVEDAEEAGEFSGEEVDEEDDDSPSRFDDKPPKAPVSEETMNYNEKRAAEVLGSAALIPEDN